jgi:hypothetical protein
MKQEVKTAQQKIDAESEWARTWANVKMQRAERVEYLLDELHRLDVGEGVGSGVITHDIY